MGFLFVIQEEGIIFGSLAVVQAGASL